jgi:uncharacterized protein
VDRTEPATSMPGQEIDYGGLVERALRRVVFDALTFVAEHGMPGRHHMYITFRTDHQGVAIDEGLRARYPTEMTIVLQYEYWDLEVRPDRFAVTLSFADVPQRLDIPFEAVTVFADPSVEFGLQFAPRGEAANEPSRPAAKPDGKALAGPRPKRRSAEPASSEPSGSAEVVALDRFRNRK